ncbi:hypothetical protein TKK_0001044 [Trichogramma kaykai]|uniref:Protein SAAL1 n=1 Tax=Trichogramma kaykai TaxID=54128 RepID=A0ABD2WRG6_9HYME
MDTRSSSNATNNMDCNIVDEVDEQIIRGDQIGDTMYSAHWVLDFILSLTKEDKKDEDMIEGNLSTIWDMTADEQVVTFLLENQFYDVALVFLKSSRNDRHIEQLIGIIANLTCQTNALESLSEKNELVNIILMHLSGSDTETLLQVFRLIKCFIHDIKINPNSFWLKKLTSCEILVDSLNFILCNSSNENLLMSALELICLMTEIKLPNSNQSLIEGIFDVEKLLHNFNIATQELIHCKNDVHDDNEIKVVNLWFSFYETIFHKKLYKFTHDQADENFKTMNDILTRMLKPYECSSNLELFENDCFDIIENCIKMASFFECNQMLPSKELLQTVALILLNIQSVMSQDDAVEIEKVKQLHITLSLFWVETHKLLSKKGNASIFDSNTKDCEKFIEKITSEFPQLTIEIKDIIKQ